MYVLYTYKHIIHMHINVDHMVQGLEQGGMALNPKP